MFNEIGEQFRAVETDSRLSQFNEVIDDNESEISEASDEILGGDHVSNPFPLSVLAFSVRLFDRCRSS